MGNGVGNSDLLLELLTKVVLKTLTPVERSINARVFGRVVQSLILLVIRIVIDVLTRTSLSTDDLEGTHKPFGKASVTMSRVVHRVGDGTTRPRVFPQKLRGICVPMQEVLHTSNFLWKWLPLLRRLTVEPVIEECLGEY